MPPPVVKCCICGEEVLKAQTYAIAGGRACKKHEGVVEQSQQIQQKAIDDKSRQRAAEDERERRREERMNMPHASMEANLSFARDNCWCCGRVGLEHSMFMQLQLAAMEKAQNENINVFGELVGDHAFKNMLLAVLKRLGAECVFKRFDLNDEMFERYVQWEARIDHRVRDIVRFGRVIQLCGDCQNGTGIKFDFESIIPKVPLQTLLLVGSAYENSDFHKHVQEIAKNI